MDISMAAAASDISTGLDGEVLSSVNELLGPKTVDDIRDRARRFEEDKANGDLYGQLMFAHGVIWACNKIKGQQIKSAMERQEAEIYSDPERLYNDMTDREVTESFTDEDDREAVREIYKGMTYRYYMDDIGIQFKGVAYVNAIDEAGNLVVLRLKDGVICGVTPT